MAIVTMTYQGPADGQPSVSLAHTGSTSDAMEPLFFACYREAYGNYYDTANEAVTHQATGVDAEGSPVNFPAATDAQIYDAFAQGVAAGVSANVTGFIKAQAMTQALAAAPTFGIKATGAAR